MKTQIVLLALCLALIYSCAEDEYRKIKPGRQVFNPTTSSVIVEDFDDKGDLVVVDEFEKENDGSVLEFRGVGAKEILIVRLTTDDGSALFSAEQARSLLQNRLEEFWQWHLPYKIDYGSVATADVFVSGSVPKSYSLVLDFINDAVIKRALELTGLSEADLMLVIVLLPPGNYGYSGITSSGKILINTGIPQNKLLFTLAHELGHFYGLGHSKLQLFENCEYGQVMPLGGDDVMGQVMQKLNPWHLDKLQVLQSIDVHLEQGQSVVVWLDPLENDKRAIKIGKQHYVYYRGEDDRASITDGQYRRKTQPISRMSVAQVKFNIKCEGRREEALTDYRVRVCAFGYVFLDMDITAEGVIQLPLLTTLDQEVWIAAPGYLATNLHVAANQIPGTFEVFLKAGDTNEDGVVNTDDLSGAPDFNLDGKINDVDLALIRNNFGLAQDKPQCEPYIIPQLNYEVVIGQHWQIYRDAGIDIKELFPESIGVPQGDAVWIQIRKAEPRCL